MIEAVRKADILFCLLHDMIDRDVIMANPNLRLIAAQSITPSNIDVETAIDQQLHRATRRAAPFRQITRERERRCFDRARRYHTVDQAPVTRLARIQPAAQQHQLLRAPRTDQAWQALTPVATGDQRDVRVLVTEARRLVGDDVVAHENQLQPARQRQAMHNSNARRRHALDPIHHTMPWRSLIHT